MWSTFSDCKRIKLELIIIICPGKPIWKLNYTLLNNAYFKKEITNNLETISNWTTMKIHNQNMDTAKPVVWGNFTALNTWVRKEETSEIKFAPQEAQKSQSRENLMQVEGKK